MDVRCEKCHTEYELDDAKVTEAGVTVKCTSCGNLFKIKRRGAQSAPRVESPSDSGTTWLIRSPTGENRRFRELTTLQQWIVERKVTRDCEISRSGETWKKLGDIAELASFFAIVDQAQTAARPTPSQDRKATQPFAPASLSPARPPPIPSAPSVPAFVSQPTVPAASASEPMLLGGPAEAGKRSTESASARIAPTAIISKPKARESWSGPAVAAPDGSEPAWAKGRAADSRSSQPAAATSGSFGATDDFGDLEMLRRRPRGRTGLWAALGILLIGGGGVIYVVATRRTGAVEAVVPDASRSPAADAPKPVVTPGIGADGPPAAPIDPKALESYAQAVARLTEDTDDAFAASEKLLESAHVTDDAQDGLVFAALTRLNTAVAQVATDDAASSADGARANEQRAEADRRIKRAETFARQAEAKAPSAIPTAIAVADLLRLQKKDASEVEKRLAAAG